MATGVIRLTPFKALAANRLYWVTARDTLTDVDGNPIGSSNGAPGADFTAQVGAGTKFAITDADGDKASLRISNGGVIQWSRLPGEPGPSIRLANAVAGSSALSGTVTKSLGGDGRVTLGSLTGSLGVNLARLPRCASTDSNGCFDVGAISAMVVDAMLESDVSQHVARSGIRD